MAIFGYVVLFDKSEKEMIKALVINKLNIGNKN